MTAVPTPKRDDSPRRGTKRPCPHPKTKKVNGKTCCAKCGVQLYL